MGSMFNHAFGGLNYQDQEARPDLVVEVSCSLNELYTGHPKEVEYSKKVINVIFRLSIQMVDHCLLKIIKNCYK